jgi:hypothetical protein
MITLRPLSFGFIILALPRPARSSRISQAGYCYVCRVYCHGGNTNDTFTLLFSSICGESCLDRRYTGTYRLINLARFSTFCLGYPDPATHSRYCFCKAQWSQWAFRQLDPPIVGTLEYPQGLLYWEICVARQRPWYLRQYLK